jgi:hypothetical protein
MIFFFFFLIAPSRGYQASVAAIAVARLGPPGIFSHLFEIPVKGTAARLCPAELFDGTIEDLLLGSLLDEGLLIHHVEAAAHHGETTDGVEFRLLGQSARNVGEAEPEHLGLDKLVRVVHKRALAADLGRDGPPLGIASLPPAGFHVLAQEMRGALHQQFNVLETVGTRNITARLQKLGLHGLAPFELHVQVPRILIPLRPLLIAVTSLRRNLNQLWKEPVTCTAAAASAVAAQSRTSKTEKEKRKQRRIFHFWFCFFFGFWFWFFFLLGFFVLFFLFFFSFFPI